MIDSVRVAAAAADTQPGQIQQNLEKIKLWAAQAADRAPQLVLFPELSLSGFIPNHPFGQSRELAASRR